MKDNAGQGFKSSSSNISTVPKLRLSDKSHNYSPVRTKSERLKSFPPEKINRTEENSSKTTRVLHTTRKIQNLNRGDQSSRIEEAAEEKADAFITSRISKTGAVSELLIPQSGPKIENRAFSDIALLQSEEPEKLRQKHRPPFLVNTFQKPVLAKSILPPQQSKIQPIQRQMSTQEIKSLIQEYSSKQSNPRTLEEPTEVKIPSDFNGANRLNSSENVKPVETSASIVMTSPQDYQLRMNRMKRMSQEFNQPENTNLQVENFSETQIYNQPQVLEQKISEQNQPQQFDRKPDQKSPQKNFVSPQPIYQPRPKKEVLKFTPDMLKDQEMLIKTMRQQGISENLMIRQFENLLAEQRKQLRFIKNPENSKLFADDTNKITSKIQEKIPKLQNDLKPEWMAHITPDRNPSYQMNYENPMKNELGVDNVKFEHNKPENDKSNIFDNNWNYYKDHTDNTVPSEEHHYQAHFDNENYPHQYYQNQIEPWEKIKMAQENLIKLENNKKMYHNIEHKIVPSSLIEMKIEKEVVGRQKRNNGLQDLETAQKILEKLKIEQQNNVIKLNGTQDPNEAYEAYHSILKINENANLQAQRANGLENNRNSNNPQRPKKIFEPVHEEDFYEYPRQKMSNYGSQLNTFVVQQAPENYLGNQSNSHYNEQFQHNLSGSLQENKNQQMIYHNHQEKNESAQYMQQNEINRHWMQQQLLNQHYQNQREKFHQKYPQQNHSIPRYQENDLQVNSAYNNTQENSLSGPYTPVDYIQSSHVY